MRFDKKIELYSIEIVEDGLGGREEKLTFIKSVYSNFNNLTVEETVKIYGEAMTGIFKVTTLGKIIEMVDRVKFENKIYKVKNRILTKNKTSFLLEVIEDEN